MKNKLVFSAAFFLLSVIFLTGGFYLSTKAINNDDERSEYIVALNEIMRLNASKDYDLANKKINDLQEILRNKENLQKDVSVIPLLCGASVFLVVAMFWYIYSAILRPFEKMKDFAAKISMGDFDVPLNYERSNYFGEFTWAFDSMRKEITKSRASEKEAIENNKTVIATLSHDIKTPIASIRAYAEGLSANLDKTYEKREKYLRVIMKKCDEVSRLVDDLFLHSLSNLDRLKLTAERIEICAFTESIVNEIAAEQEDVIFRKPDFIAYVNADKNRFTQLCENIINNARKYAKTTIDVFLTMENENIVLHFRDWGSGIPDEDMPFIFDKFYRGNNCGSEQGSGLGLYIVKYIAEKMSGKVVLQNHEIGLEVKLILPVIK